MLFWFHSAMGQEELCSNTEVLNPCKASCEPVGFYPTKTCDDFPKHHYLTWRDRRASFRPFIVQFFFPSLFCPTLPETLLLHKIFHSFFALHTIVWAAWVVSHYSHLLFFFTKKEDNISEAYLCPLLTCVTEEYGYTRGRKKCSWNPWDLGLHCLLWKQG